jgi:FkbM family methyltransferase
MKDIIKGIIVTAIKLKDFDGTMLDKIKLFFLLSSISIKKHTNKNSDKLIQVNFLKYKITGFSYSTLQYLINEIFIDKEYFFTVDAEMPIIIDCGSNIGISIIYFKNLYPKAKILAFEADPYVFKILNKNITENNLDVTLNNCALCNSNEPVSFYMCNGPWNLKGSILKQRGGTNKVDVEGRKLSSYISKYKRIDLIKIDIEGAEIEVINDLYAHNMLGIANNYIIEFHHNIEDKKTYLSDFLRKFEEFSFGYNIRTNFKKKGSFQDICLHFYKVAP